MTKDVFNRGVFFNVEWAGTVTEEVFMKHVRLAGIYSEYDEPFRQECLKEAYDMCVKNYNAAHQPAPDPDKKKKTEEKQSL